MKNKRSLEDLQAASNHLHYEIEMLRSLASVMESGLLGVGALNNAVLEAFVIHVRNVIFFLWAENPKNDHIIASDFFNKPDDWEKIRPEKSHILKESEVRSHKEVAHLSYDRIKVSPEKKAWHFLEIKNEIISVFDIFLNSIPIENLGDQWKQHIQGKETE